MLPTRSQAPTLIGGSVSGLVAGIASVLVGGAGGGTSAGGGGGGGGATSAGGGAATGAGGGGGAASAVACAQALPALRAPVNRIVTALPILRKLERSIILFPPSCLNFEGDHIEHVLT